MAMGLLAAMLLSVAVGVPLFVEAMLLLTIEWSLVRWCGS